MNKYLKNIEKIEFLITLACTGKCRHCSEGEHEICGEHINANIATDTLREVCSYFQIKTVMAFGGEPLLYSDAVYKIMSTATALRVPKRQVITNGFFTSDHKILVDTAKTLLESGVNELLVSVDAFHQETIPLEIVKEFALNAKSVGIPVKLQPAWLVSRENINPYNTKTKDILEYLRGLGLEENEGNIIFPEGNAVKYLAEYFTNTVPDDPYINDPKNVKCLSVSPNGNVLKGNIYRQNIIKILNEYTPD